MSTLTFEVPDEQAERLEAAARKDGLPLEELLRKLTVDYLDRKEKFEVASEYVLQKNAELYRRLAK
jgi:antitoxin FitA